MEILRDLFTLTTSPLFVVIDGIEHIDDTVDPSVTASVQEFCDVLFKVVTNDQKRSVIDKMVKILFTAGGDCRSLLERQMILDIV